MARHRWHILRDGASVTVARHLPVRLDLAVEGCLPLPASRPVSRTRVAQQIRQDMWRALQNLRGFSPVVRVVQDGAILRVTAGGRLAAKAGAGDAETKIAALLERPEMQARWLAHAARRAAHG